jgi:hypothetical protein
MDLPADPNNNNNNANNQQLLPPSTPLNKQSMAEELKQTERREQRSLLDQIMGAVDGLA